MPRRRAYDILEQIIAAVGKLVYILVDEGAADLLEYLVAYEMAVGVVDILELVAIQEEQGYAGVLPVIAVVHCDIQVLVLAPDPLEFGFEAFDEGELVQKPGKAVEGRHLECSGVSHDGGKDLGRSGFVRK
jgi:hypothetical protein